MSRTKRFYNFPNKIDNNHNWNFYHPYRQFCCGNCPRCKAGKIREKKTAKAQKREIVKRILIEFINNNSIGDV